MLSQVLSKKGEGLPSNGIKYNSNDKSKQPVQRQKHQEKIWYGEMVKRIQHKCKDLRKFNDNKKTLLKMLLATLLFLRDIYFSGRGGELTF